MFMVMEKRCLMMDKYTFELSDQFLSVEEQLVFDEYLNVHELDRGIWEVFASLFRSGVRNTQPLMLRIYSDNELFGAIVLTRCSGYGKALFDNKLLSRFHEFIQYTLLPVDQVWMLHGYDVQSRICKIAWHG